MGRLVTGAYNPVVLYVSGGNTQVFTAVVYSLYMRHDSMLTASIPIFLFSPFSFEFSSLFLSFFFYVVFFVILLGPFP